MNAFKILFSLLSIVIVLNGFVLGQSSKPNSITAYRITEKIEIDGDHDEDAWDEATYISNFTQRELDEGQPATEETRVAVLYNDTHLYIGVEALESNPEGIIAKESRRDFSWQSEDNFEIILGPFDDKRSGYLFVVNPNGAIADVLVTDDGAGFNRDWNGVWQAAVEIDDEGWFIEIEIPFSTLKFPDSDEQVWALNMERNIRRKNEQVLWQGWSRDYDLEKLSQAGTLTGLKGIRSATKWELKPYITAGIEKERGEKRKEKWDIGGDLNYQLSPIMKLNVTLNTDFSQVEADREEINLSRFDLFFPEKRDFFLDGKNLFEFNLGSSAQTFYSRRIGLKNRKEIPILGGARITGKAGDTNIGLLSIQEAEKDSLHSTNYSVIRVKQNILDQSNIGFIVTSKNNTKRHSLLYGVDANYRTSDLFENKNFAVGAAISQSFIKNEKNKDNTGYYAYATYPNDNIYFQLSTSRIMQNYNPEVGFLRRKDYKLYSSELELNPRPDWFSFIKSIPVKPFEIDYYISDSDNELESMEFEFSPIGVEFASGDAAEFNILRLFDKPTETFEIIDELFIPAAEYWYTRYEIAAETFEGRRLFSELQYSWGDFYSGERREFEINLGLNLHERLNLSADWERNYIKLSSETFTTDEIGSRLEYAFNPTLNTSIFSQWNNEDEEMILNFRINWIPRAGSFFYFVVNQEYATGNTFSAINTTVLTKLTWLFSL